MSVTHQKTQRDNGNQYALAHESIGNLQYDLPNHFAMTGHIAKAAGSGWVLLIDELQCLANKDLAALIMAMHRMSQENLQGTADRRRTTQIHSTGWPREALCRTAVSVYQHRALATSEPEGQDFSRIGGNYQPTQSRAPSCCVNPSRYAHCALGSHATGPRRLSPH